MQPAENTLENIEYFVYNTFFSLKFLGKSILKLISCILNNSFLIAMFIVWIRRLISENVQKMDFFPPAL
jgi:hypothetical protein